MAQSSQDRDDQTLARILGRLARKQSTPVLIVAAVLGGTLAAVVAGARTTAWETLFAFGFVAVSFAGWGLSDRLLLADDPGPIPRTIFRALRVLFGVIGVASAIIAAARVLILILGSSWKS